MAIFNIRPTFTSPEKAAPAFLKKNLPAAHNTDQILVVIQLSGGNDGLNSIVPYQNDIYYRSRPHLALPKNTLVHLDDMHALHPALTPLKKYYDEGTMCIINGVGYPNPNRSHFRSMDIYQSAAPDSYEQSGWIGRYLDEHYQHFPEHLAIPKAIEVNSLPSLVMKGKQHQGIAFENAQTLETFFEKPFFKNLYEQNTDDFTTHNETLDFLYQTLNVGAASSAYINEKVDLYTLKSPFPNYELGKKLHNIAQMILSGVESSVYYTSLGSFDTHVSQSNRHAKLLGMLAESVDAFITALKSQAQFKRVTIVVFSEFGRRVAENAAQGTDHGVGNFMLLFSRHLAKSGFFNPMNNLQNLFDGDVPWEIDFRQVYAALLENILQTPAKTVLKGNFEPLPLFKNQVLLT